MMRFPPRTAPMPRPRASPNFFPSYAGRAMESELSHLEKALANPTRPLMAVVGGAKVSSKIDLLENLAGKVDTLVIGGAMANTFLAAQGLGVGKSLHEPDYLETARKVVQMAATKAAPWCCPAMWWWRGNSSAGAPHRTVPVSAIAPTRWPWMWALRPSPPSKKALPTSKTLVWNGPLGAFETAPFDAGTVAAAKAVAEATKAGQLLSVAGGGDTVAALAHAGVENDFTYVSTAGGAFLEWLEGKELPGVEALKANTKRRRTNESRRIEQHRQKDGGHGQGPARRRRNPLPPSASASTTSAPPIPRTTAATIASSCSAPPMAMKNHISGVILYDETIRQKAKDGTTLVN